MNEESKVKLMPKNDVIFKRLFSKKGNESILKDFLSAVLDVEIEDLEVDKETHLIPEMINEKLGILDVRATLKDGTEIDIEVQNLDTGDITKRVFYYLNRLYVGQLKRGVSYKELKKTIVIAILNFEYFKDIKEYHTKWKMTEKKNIKKTLDEEEIHFIELPKFLKKQFNSQDKVEQWLAFIVYSRKEWVKMAVEKNSEVKKAEEEYEYLTGEEAEKRLAFLREKGERDYNSGMEYAREVGLKEGEEKGRKENKKEIAKKMKEKGIEYDMISDLTNLSKDEIEKL